MYRKMTGAALLLVLFLFVLLREPSVLARESAPLLPEGSGTVEDPYLIRTADELALVSGNLNASYRLAADIDLRAFPG